MSRHVPVGFHFSPTDQELLMSYLRRMVLRQPLPWDGIVEKELYGDNANPWDLFSEDDPWECPTTADDSGKANKQKIFYVFTKLSKVGKGSKNIVRVAGSGTWHGQTGAKDIVIGKTKTKIGSKRMFTFKSRKGLEGKGHWIMHEYSLSDVGLTGIGSTDYVICRITKDESKDFKKKNTEISRVSEHKEADWGDLEVLNYVGCSEEQQISTQALGKRKSSEDNYIPQEKKTPRMNSLDELPTGVDQSNMPESHIRIGIDKDAKENNGCSNMAQGNFLHTESCSADPTMTVAYFLECQEMVQLLCHADNGLQAEGHMINGVTEDANGTATCFTESNCNNTENIDASANIFVPQDVQTSIEGSEYLLFDDTIDLSFLEDI